MLGDIRSSRGGNARNGRCTFPNVRRRKERASEREAFRKALTPAQQIAILDQRLGSGVGAVRERARLNGLLK